LPTFFTHLFCLSLLLVVFPACHYTPAPSVLSQLLNIF
jgi:hypothetical protein